MVLYHTPMLLTLIRTRLRPRRDARKIIFHGFPLELQMVSYSILE